MRKLPFVIIFLMVSATISAQMDSLKSRLVFDSDFRFRIEQDWNSKKSNGTFREDRTRLRYRLRAGAKYRAKWYEVGFRLRTGNPRKQQDPQLTLGDGFKEFGTLSVGIEKLYFKGYWNTFNFWVGKNDFLFEKNNELFWSDNVYPEGISLEKSIGINSSIIDLLVLRGGHYIVSTSNKSLNQDAYFQGYQIYSSFLNNQLVIFPSLYLFKNIPDVPDGNDTFLLDYSIAHLGTKFKLLKNVPLSIELDYYKNLHNYNNNDSIPQKFKGQKSGVVVGLKYGALKEKGDWFFSTTYAKLQQFSAIDFLAQNDWARWDYSSFGSPDGRLTNFNGIELVSGYKINKKMSLKMKYYVVDQLIPLGISKETGNRIRLDLDVKF